MKHIYIILCLLVAFATSIEAQNKNILYTNVTIHVGTGQIIEKGAVGIKNGKIAAVSENADALKKDYKTIIDGEGQHLYPTFIAPNTRLGLEEVEAVRAMRDYREVGHFNPNVRSLIAYNTDSKVTPTIRSNGILLTQVVPEGGRISGQSSILYTEADNYEDAAFLTDDAIHLRWPNRYHYSGWWAQPGPTKSNKNYDRDLQSIQVYMDAAQAYYKKEMVETKNIKFEAMKGLFEKNKRLFVHVDDARGMMEAVRMLKPYGVDVVIQGGAEAWQITDFLKEYNIPVILSNVHRLPQHRDSDIDQPYKTPNILHENGVKFAFSMEGSWNVRNLMFQAGQAVAYGLPKETAVKALTLQTAEILGISKRVGSIEVGKDATFIVSKGDALDMRTSIVTDAYIMGKKVDLSDKQKVLYEKYKEKYELKD